jgi:hypothetical protein
MSNRLKLRRNLEANLNFKTIILNTWRQDLNLLHPV